MLSENLAKAPILLSEFLSMYLARSHRSERYKKMYQNTMNHVLRFCEINKLDSPLTNEVGIEFCEDFVFYLKSDCRHMQNTVKGHIERLHAILQKAALHGYPVNNTFREVTIQEEEIGAVYLSMTEITRIYYFENLTRSQKEIRDLFVIGCLTGLRYSDYSHLTQNNFIENNSQIRIKTRKTGAVVQLPSHKFVREILEKYAYRIPKPRGIQYFNLAIKQICKMVGLVDTIPYERTIGTEIVRKTFEKWEMISSHTARRSFATNMFLMGVPPYRIMLITGHRSEKSFFKYVRITREENALVLSNHQFFQ
jgi:integrase